LLDWEQRAVFIMRNVLGMSWEAISNATKQPIDAVRQNWLRGMVRVRESPRDFFRSIANAHAEK